LGKPLLEAPLEEYLRCGFLLTPNTDGSIDIQATEAKHKELAISCSLNLSFWGPNGNFTVDPDEDGLLIHIPIHGQQFTKPTSSPNRKIITHGRWFIDIVYALDKSSTEVVDKQFDDSFKLSKGSNDALILKRKFVHDLYQYRWPYVLNCYPNGRATISLKRPIVFRGILRRHLL